MSEVGTVICHLAILTYTSSKSHKFHGKSSLLLKCFLQLNIESMIPISKCIYILAELSDLLIFLSDGNKGL